MEHASRTCLVYGINGEGKTHTQTYGLNFTVLFAICGKGLLSLLSSIS